jgi:hypothetical protein
VGLGPRVLGLLLSMSGRLLLSLNSRLLLTLSG